MGRRDYYGKRPKIPVIWMNIGIGLLAAIAIGIGVYVLLKG
jgi:high-affinity Fe2+/Pb2+ permease